MYVFVYGTLKKGYSNHGLLAGTKYCGTFKTLARYSLYDCGAYPCLVHDDNGTAIKGEIYHVDNEIIKKLDHLEGVPFLYTRENIDIPNFPHEVLAYFFQRDVSRLTKAGSCWPM